MSILNAIKKLFQPSPEHISDPIPYGNIYNLQEIYNEINTKYFQGKVRVKIEWSKRLTKAARAYRRLGSYYPQKKLIRVNPLLDSSDFPPYFISYIVYHEMLHHVYPPYRKKGKWQIHHPTFKKMEKEFEDYATVKQWEKDNKTMFFKG